jgi:hypothetical protein
LRTATPSPSTTAARTARRIKVVGRTQPSPPSRFQQHKNFTLQGTGSLAATGRLHQIRHRHPHDFQHRPEHFTAAALEGGTVSLTTANALGTAPITFTGGTLAFSADQSNAPIMTARFR